MKRESIKSRVLSVALAIILCGALIFTGCVKQSEIRVIDAQDLPLDGVTLEQAAEPAVKAVPPPPPTPIPVPAPIAKPEVQATYVPKPAPKPKPVAVAPVEPPKEYINTMVARRAYLIEDQTENLGLCTYILLPPSQGRNFNRYTKLHAAFRDTPQYQELKIKEEVEAQTQSNVLYWPLKKAAFASNAHNIFDKNDAFFVNNYDFKAASAVLKTIKGIEDLKGPFIAASRSPLFDKSGKRSSDLMIIDLSTVRASDFGDVAASFVSKIQNTPAAWKTKFDMDFIEFSLNSEFYRV